MGIRRGENFLEEEKKTKLTPSYQDVEHGIQRWQSFLDSPDAPPCAMPSPSSPPTVPQTKATNGVNLSSLEVSEGTGMLMESSLTFRREEALTYERQQPGTREGAGDH